VKENLKYGHFKFAYFKLIDGAVVLTDTAGAEKNIAVVAAKGTVVTEQSAVAAETKRIGAVVEIKHAGPDHERDTVGKKDVELELHQG
jgi:hypothetical protein